MIYECYAHYAIEECDLFNGWITEREAGRVVTLQAPTALEAARHCTMHLYSQGLVGDGDLIAVRLRGYREGRDQLFRCAFELTPSVRTTEITQPRTGDQQ